MLCKFRERKRGFTVIELLLVIAMCAVLAMAAIPSLVRAQRIGKESTALRVLKSLRNAEDAYKSKHKAAFGNLDQLQKADASPVGENEVDAVSGYTFRSSGVSGEHYTITATAPAGKGLVSYAMTETGEVTQK